MEHHLKVSSRRAHNKAYHHCQLVKAKKQLWEWVKKVLRSRKQILCNIRVHQSRQRGRNSRPISAEVALPRLQRQIKVALFLLQVTNILGKAD